MSEKMIFEYNELKEYVEEDIERFCGLGFDENQIVSALFEEYKYGKGFCVLENICICLFVALNYMRNNKAYKEITEKLKKLRNELPENEIEAALGDSYNSFIREFNRVISVLEENNK